MSKKVLDLQFPLGGLNRRLAFQRQPPFTFADGLNVRPVWRNGRMLLGRAPGSDVYSTFLAALNSLTPNTMMNSVAYVAEDGWFFREEHFRDGALEGNIGHCTNSPDSLTSANYFGNDYIQVEDDDELRLYYQAPPDNFSAAAGEFEIGINIAPYAGSVAGTFLLFLYMDNASPDPYDDGIVIEVGSSLTIKEYVAGVPSTLSTALTAAGAGWLRVKVNGNAIAVFVNGIEVDTATGGGSYAGAKVGFGIRGSAAGAKALVDTFIFQGYRSTDDTNLKRVLVAMGTGGLSAAFGLYRENLRGYLENVASTLTISQTRYIASQEYFQKLYLADHGAIVAEGTNGSVSTAAFDSATYADWTAVAIDANDYAVEIYAGSGTTLGVYAISSIAVGSITLASSPGDGTGLSFRIWRCPKIFDPKTNAITRWLATAGAIPMGCPLICSYRGRLVLAGAEHAPHLASASRIDNPLDFDFDPADGENDAGRAWYLTGGEAGEIGEPILCMLAHSNDYLLFGCESSLWILRGDVTAGGIIEPLSRTSGAAAMCAGPAGETYIFGRDGLWMLPPGSGQPVPLSQEVLPNEFKHFNFTSQYQVMMAYDLSAHGIMIGFREKELSTNPPSSKGYFFDLSTKSFWPEQLGTGAVKHLVPINCGDSLSYSGVLMAEAGRAYKSDFNRPIYVAESGYCFIGPLRLGGSEYHEGLLLELIATLSDLSANVTWSVHVGPTAEAAINASAFTSGTWSRTSGSRKGLNFRNIVRARGSAAFLKVSGSGLWALERIEVVVGRFGKERAY